MNSKLIKSIVCIACILIATVTGQAQNMFQQSIDGVNADVGTGIEQTSDGGFIQLGYGWSLNPISSDVYVTKTDAFGTTEWSKVYTGAAIEGWGIIPTKDGGYAFCGTIDYGSTNEALLVKLDSAGGIMWSSMFGSAVGNDWANSLLETPAGDFVVTGQYDTGTDIDLLMAKISSTGDTVWTKRIGGAQNDWGGSVIMTSDGGFVAAGFTDSYGAGNDDIYLVKVDSMGSLLWSKTFGGSGFEYGYDVIETAGNGLLIVGEGTSWGTGPANTDIYVIKTDAKGDTLWTYVYGDSTDNVGFSVIERQDSSYLIAGCTDCYVLSSNDYFLAIDSNGIVMGAKRYAGTVFRSVVNVLHNGLAVTGDGFLLDTVSGDIHTIKSDENFVTSCFELAEFAIEVGTTTDTTCPSSICVMGMDTFNFNMIVIDTALINTIICDSCPPPTAHFGNSFTPPLTINFLDSSILADSWFLDFGDGDSSMLQNPSHTYTSGGSFTVTLYATNICGTDTFIKQVPILVSINNKSDRSMKLYPNPVADKLYLSANFNVETAEQVSVHDILGREMAVNFVRINSNEYVLDLGGLPTGSYFINIRLDDQLIKERFVLIK